MKKLRFWLILSVITAVFVLCVANIAFSQGGCDPPVPDCSMQYLYTYEKKLTTCSHCSGGVDNAKVLYTDCKWGYLCVGPGVQTLWP